MVTVHGPRVTNVREKGRGGTTAGRARAGRNPPQVLGRSLGQLFVRAEAEAARSSFPERSAGYESRSPGSSSRTTRRLWKPVTRQLFQNNLPAMKAGHLAALPERSAGYESRSPDSFHGGRLPGPVNDRGRRCLRPVGPKRQDELSGRGGRPVRPLHPQPAARPPGAASKQCRNLFRRCFSSQVLDYLKVR